MTRLAALAAVAALALAAAPALAAPSSIYHADDKVPGHPGLVFADLVRLAVPDLAKGDDDYEGHLKANPRHLAGKEFQADEPDNVELGFLEMRRIQVGGRPRLLLLADLGPKPGMVAGLALLMLITDEEKPRLLDAADVGLDKDSVLIGEDRPRLGPGEDGFVTYSEHDDADLSMGGYLAGSAVGDRLALVDTFMVTSETLCSWSGQEDATFTTAPDPGRAYRRFEITVRAVFKPTGQDGCTDDKMPLRGTHLFRATYRWDAAARRYRVVSSQLPALEKLNNGQP